MRLSDRVVLIAGAGSGIGRATAHAMGSEDAAIIATDIDRSQAEAVTAELRDMGVKAIALAMDVTDGNSVRDTVARSIRHFDRIDVLVNSAGVWPADGLIDMDEAAWDRDLQVCLTGTFLTCKHVLPHMIRQRSGAIVSITSVNGLEFLGAEAYSSAKAGVISLTKAVAVRYGPDGVRANAIAPATIQTPIWEASHREDPELFERLTRLYPLGRVGSPEDVAHAAVFLASEEANWISGVVLPVDGGFLAGRQGFVDETKDRQ